MNIRQLRDHLTKIIDLDDTRVELGAVIEDPNGVLSPEVGELLDKIYWEVFEVTSEPSPDHFTVIAIRPRETA